MTKQQIIKRLIETLDKLKILPKEKFNYKTWIDFEDGCGTVCCVAGWYPVWFKDRDWIYYIGDNPYNLVAIYPKYKDNRTAIRGLVDYHSIICTLIDALFIGYPLERLPSITHDAPLDDVINRWEKIIYILESSTHFDKYLIIDEKAQKDAKEETVV